MIAKIIKVANEEGQSTCLQIEGKVYEAMDCIGYQKKVTEGDIIDVEFSVGIDDENETVEQILDGNPDCIEELFCTGGWSYKAYGFIQTLDPVIVSCGDVQINEPFDINDASLIGKYVAFHIGRLDVWAV